MRAAAVGAIGYVAVSGVAWITGVGRLPGAYPDVLVAHADNDGAALELVLQPGNGPVRTTLGIQRLAPLRSYSVTGRTAQRITADNDGRALVDIDLHRRTEVTIRPIP